MWVVLAMVSVSLAWWGFVHRERFDTMIRTGAVSTLGSLALALLAISFGHSVAFGLGGAFHAIMGLK